MSPLCLLYACLVRSSASCHDSSRVLLTAEHPALIADAAAAVEDAESIWLQADELSRRPDMPAMIANPKSEVSSRRITTSQGTESTPRTAQAGSSGCGIISGQLGSSWALCTRSARAGLEPPTLGLEELGLPELVLHHLTGPNHHGTGQSSPCHCRHGQLAPSSDGPGVREVSVDNRMWQVAQA